MLKRGWFPRLLLRAVLIGALIGAALLLLMNRPGGVSGAGRQLSITPTATPLTDFSFDGDQVTAAFCAEIASAWQGSDWPRVIRDLRAVQRMTSATPNACGSNNLAAKLYPAYYNYGAVLEKAGDLPGALNAYQQALSYKADGQEAALALRRYDALTPVPRPTCSDSQLADALTLPAYQPSGTGSFVQVNGAQFTLDGAPFAVHGVNYYPATAPWRRFLTASTPAIFGHDLDLIGAAGFNVIRIFLWYGALFDCPGSGVIPDRAAFARLDALLQLAAAHGLRVLVTLNDLPDLVMYPLYTDSELPAAQTAFIVNRYRYERAILAWDVRNEGDVDYLRSAARDVEVNAWLNQTVSAVRRLDSQHPITAGWDDNGISTAGIVDVVSLHHWSAASTLASRLQQFRAATNKPILLEEIGYSGYLSTEGQQLDALKQAIQIAEGQHVAGWILWQAFDILPGAACDPPDCPGPDNAEYHFGLWRTDGSPKQAVAAITQWLSATTTPGPAALPTASG